jgi:hypothetical protein
MYLHFMPARKNVSANIAKLYLNRAWVVLVGLLRFKTSRVQNLTYSSFQSIAFSQC